MEIRILLEVCILFESYIPLEVRTLTEICILLEMYILQNMHSP